MILRSSSSEGLLFLALIIFATVFCLVRWLAIVTGATPAGPERLKRRLRELRGLGGGAEETILLKHPNSASPFLEELLKKIQILGKIQTLITQADLRWKVSSFLLLELLCGGVGLAWGFFQGGPFGGAGGAGVGLFLPYKFLLIRRKRRLKQFEKLLPDTLDLLARSLRAGHALPAGLQLVAQEMAEPIGSEFLKTYREYSHGVDLNATLVNLCQRVDLRDLGFFTTAVLIQRETGGNLTEILEKIAMLIRERFKLRNQIRALTAEGRLSGLILVLLPPIMAAILFFINPEYESLLLNHPTGRMISLLAVGFQLLGIFAIRKIVNIKV